MRNLAGRLTARSIPDLARIADFWQTVVTGRDRHAVVGQLYREMREPRSARDAWTRLDPPERLIIQIMALDDQHGEVSRTIPELAATLGWSEDDTRDVAISLYRKGVLFREGDDEELPIGQLPRVLLPRELTTTFRRVQDEIDAGPLQRVPLPALLALLDDNELEEAANFWDVESLPGLRDRDEIILSLTQAMASESRRIEVLRSLTGDSLDVWNALSGAAGQTLPLNALMEMVGISGEGVALAQRRRTAIGRLEERLLAWHTYGPNEERFLFIPVTVRAETPKQIERRVPEPERVSAGAVESDPWNHPWAVPWDLLTLLREVSGNQALGIVRFENVPGAWLDDLSYRLWNPSSREQLPGYLSFLSALGRQENVLLGGDGSDSEPLAPGRSWKQWRTRSFADQFAHLVWWWNASPDWIEGTGRSGVLVSNAALPQFRRKVLVLLAGLDQDQWYQSESVAQWIASIDPDILGAGAAIATSKALMVPAGHPEWPRLATSAVVESALNSAFAWFGLIETGTDEDGRGVLRPTDMLRNLEDTNPVEDLASPAGPAMVVHQDLMIDLIDPAPLRVWSLSAFAELRDLRPVARYQLTEEALRRALGSGASLINVTGYLESETGGSLPEAVVQALETWPAVEKQVAIRLVAEIVPGNAEQGARIETALRESGWDVRRRNGVVEVRFDRDQFVPQWELLTGTVERLGYSDGIKPPEGRLERFDESGG